MGNKTLALIISSAQKGGAGKILKYLAKLYSNYNYNVLFISIYDEDLSADYSDKIKYISLKETPKGWLRWRMKAINKIRDIVRKENIDTVISFMSDVSLLARIATLGLPTKFISSERNDPYSRSAIWKILTIFAYGTSDICVFQLDGAKAYFPSFIKKKGIVIPNPVTDFIKSSDFERKKTIVSAGRFVEEKRFDILIKAFSVVHYRYPDYKLIIYGNGPLFQSYLSLVRTLNITDFVEFPGYINNLREALNENGLFVLSSRSEGIPNVLIEALSSGIATISTDCTPGGPRYLTEDGKYGLLVPVDDVDAIAEAIIRLLSDNDLRKKLEREGPKSLKKIKNEEIEKMWLSIV